MAADPTVEILAALNKALAEGRVTPEEYGKRAKMISAAKAQREEDRRHSKEVFDRFDTDHSGALDAAEFASLIVTLGGNMSKEETDAAFKSLDKDGGGTVDFEEFYAWWSTPEVHSAKPSKLSSLRLQLTTQHLKERSSAAAKKLNEALAKSSKKGEDDTQTINLSVSVGDFEKGSGLKISYENNEQVASDLQKEFGASGSDVVVSVAFAAVPGKEAFDLGVLSGKIRDVLALQEEIKFKNIKNDVKTIGDTVVFRVNLVVDGAEKVIADTVNTITSDLIKGASISVEVNEKVGSAFNKELQARVNLNLKLVAGGGATLLSLGMSSGKPTPLSMKKKKKKQPEALIPSILASKMREANFKIKTDTLQEAATLVVGSPAPFNNLHGLRPLFAQMLAEVRVEEMTIADVGLQLPWSELPDTMMDTYKLVVENLLGLHSITVSANKAVLKIEGEHLNIIKLLPGVAQLQSAIKAAGSDDEGEEEEEEEAKDDDKSGEEKEPVAGGSSSTAGVNWLNPPIHGLASDVPPLRNAFAQDELSTVLISMGSWPGVKLVKEEGSAMGQVVEIVASREAIGLTATIDVETMQKGVKSGKLYQPSIRVRGVKDAKLGHLQVELRALTALDDSETLEIPFSDLKIATDGTWWEVPLGEPLRSKSDGELSFKGIDAARLKLLVNTDSELVNGFKFDSFTLWQLDENADPPAACAPKAEQAKGVVERPICKGGHPMVWARIPGATSGAYSCDLCLSAHSATQFHWQCRPCDGDYCVQCYDKNGKKGEAV